MTAIDACGFSKIRRVWEENTGEKWADAAPERPKHTAREKEERHLRRRGSH